MKIGGVINDELSMTAAAMEEILDEFPQALGTKKPPKPPVEDEGGIYLTQKKPLHVSTSQSSQLEYGISISGLSTPQTSLRPQTKVVPHKLEENKRKLSEYAQKLKQEALQSEYQLNIVIAKKD